MHFCWYLWIYEILTVCPKNLFHFKKGVYHIANPEYSRKIGQEFLDILYLYITNPLLRVTFVRFNDLSSLHFFLSFLYFRLNCQI